MFYMFEICPYDNFLCSFFFSPGEAIPVSVRAAMCEPFKTWVLPTAYDEHGRLRTERGVKRCRAV